MFNFCLSILLSFSILLLTCCNQSDHNKSKTETLEATITALPQQVKSPEDNPISKEKIKLGKLLFFDPILSGNKDVSCATCHHPQHGYAEYLDLSIGVNGKGLGSSRKFNSPNDIPIVKRNAHTILNTAFNGIDTKNNYKPHNAPMFWDSRVNSLEKQSLEPIKSLEEMRGRNYQQDEILDEVVKRLKAIPEYQTLFDKAFDNDEPISSINIGKSIAAFERTLITNNSRFDQYLRGDENAMSLSEKEGFRRFKEVGCANCHSGSMLSDYKMHTLGVRKSDKLTYLDSGANQNFDFRTPTLRNLRFTTPYMHNGSLQSLKEVLEFYEDISVGDSHNLSVSKEDLDPLIKKLTIRVKDMAPILSFFNALNDTTFDKQIPEYVPSGLPVGGNIQ